MLALGCIQSLKCHTGECPTGITTHSKWRMHGIVIPEKSERVHCYLAGFHDDMLHLTKVLGHSDPRDINTEDIRIVRKENDFSKYFENDNSGFYMPSPQQLGDK
jgi:glutamate synthase domain-containing protein 2